MVGRLHILDDFKVGESVIPLSQKELTFKIIDIGNENGLIICNVPEMPELNGKFKPEELEKENILRPPDIVDVDTSEGE